MNRQIARRIKKDLRKLNEGACDLEELRNELDLKNEGNLEMLDALHNAYREYFEIIIILEQYCK